MDLMSWRALRYRGDHFASAVSFWSSASCQMIAACKTMNFEAPPQYRFRMMNTKLCAPQLCRFLKVCQRTPFLDELRRIISKIWRLLRCTRAVCRMLGNITWCMLLDETCFIVKCTHVNISVAILPFLVSLQRWLIRGAALASFLPTNVPPNRRSGGASGRRSQDQRVASVICSAHDGQPESGHTG